MSRILLQIYVKGSSEAFEFYKDAFDANVGYRDFDDDGNIKGILCKKVKSVFDEKGRFYPKFIEDMEKLLKGDMIIEAIGQRPDFSFLPDELKDKLEFTKRKKTTIFRLLLKN